MAKRLTYEKVKHFIEVESGSGCKLLSKEYKNNTGKLVFECSCGNEFVATFSNFQNKNRNKRQCNECGMQRRAKAKKLTYCEVKRYIEIESGSGCELLSKKYIGSNKKLDVLCHCGSEFKVSLNNFKAKGKTQCNNCTGHIRYTHEDVKNFVENETDGACKLLGEEYVNNTTKMTFQCSCGDIFKATFAQFKSCNKRQCNKCGFDILSGAISHEYSYVQSIINSFGLELLSKTYKRNSSAIKIKCLKCSYVFEDKFANFERRENKCPGCVANNRVSTLSSHMRQYIGEWVADSFEFYNYQCVLTGDTESLQVHHLCSFNTLLKEVMNELNFARYSTVGEYTQMELDTIGSLLLKKHYKSPLGVPLKKDMHLLFHSAYGNGDNTPKQFEEFKTRYHMGEFDEMLASKI